MVENTTTKSQAPRRIYLERFVYMAALMIPSTFLQGARVIVVCVLNVVLCMALDKICCMVRKIPYDIKDAAVPFWGLAAAMLMPVSVPYFIAIPSSVAIVVVCKHFFGSSDNILFSPSAVAVAFLVLCFPSQMLFFPKTGSIYPIFGELNEPLTRSAAHALSLGTMPSGSIADILLGSVPGAIGAVNILIIVVCGLCLVLMHGSSLWVVIPSIAVSTLTALAFPRVGSGFQSVFYELTSGYMLFGTVFMAAEPYLVPKRTAAKVLYGIVLGYITMMFRYFGQTEGAFVFALIITGTLTGTFDRIIENLIYWKNTYLSAYETSKTQVQRGKVKISDTQELVIPEKYRYNTPPIDGEVKRQHRRKRKDSEPHEEDHGDGQ